MRNFTKLMAALALLVFMMPSMAGWGQTKDEVTTTFKAGSSYTAGMTLPYETGGLAWVTSAKPNSFESQSPNRGIQYSKVSTDITTTLADASVTKVVVVASTNATANVNSLSVYVGSTQIGSTQNMPKENNKTYTFETSTGQTGEIKVSMSNDGSKSTYIKSIAVTYTTGGGVTTYTVTYDANGATSGTVPADNTEYENGATVTVLGNTGNLAKEHYTFGGWNNQANGQGTNYAAGQTFTISGNTTLYAKWNVNTHNVTMPANDQFGSYTASATSNVAYGTTVTLTYTPATGYEDYAATWSVNGNAIEGDSFIMPDEDVTISVLVAEDTKATFIFNTDEGLEALNIAKPASNAGTNLEENHDYVSGDVIMTITHGTTATRVWGGTSATDLRVYGGGGSLTFSVPSGFVITSILLTGADVNKFNDVSSGEWSGESRTVTLTASGTAKVNTISVFYEANATGVDAPEMLASCNFVDEMEIAITCPTENATIYYTTDGTNPTTTTGTEYIEPFIINNTTTVKAIAVLGGATSNIAAATYTRVYNITFEKPVGGIISASLAQAAEGTTIELIATPNVGYAFDSWTVTPSVTLSGNTFTMPANDVTVTASFIASTNSYTVSFSVNNKVEMTATVFDGGSIDLTKFVAFGENYTFDGWSDSEGGVIVENQNNYTPDGDITLYPGVYQSSADEYTLVTSVNDLHAGDLVVIAASAYDKAMSTEQKANNRGSFAISKIASSISWTPGTQYTVCEFVLGGSSSGWTFYDAVNSGYIYAAGTAETNRNYLRTEAQLDENNWGLWTITIGSNNKATIRSVGNTKTPFLKYNTGSDGMFACYNTDSQSDVVLYTKSASSKSNRDNVSASARVTSIAANVLVTVKNGGVVYLTGTNGGNASNLIVEDGGQLVSTNNVEGTMLKSITGYGNNTKGDYYFISSPFTSATSPMDVKHMINTAGYDLFYFDQTRDLEWINYKEGGDVNYHPGFNLDPGKGYLYANKESNPLEFAGTLRKGLKDGEMNTYTNSNLVYDSIAEFAGWNLVGNPFTSNATVSKAFFKMNNTSDGVNTTAVVAGGMIAPMEGVFVLSENANDNSVTFTVNQTTPSKNRSVNVNVSREGEFLDRAIVTMGEGSLLNKLYLSENITTISIPQDGNDYAIVPSNGQNEMPVSFKASRNANYTISIDAENVEMNYLHLIDNMTGADIDLLQTPSYSFEAKTTDYSQRFKLVFATGDNSNEDNFAFFSNGSFVINNEGNATLQVIDVTGRIVKSESINGCANVNVNAAPGVYMLRLVNGDNVKVQKVVVR